MPCLHVLCLYCFLASWIPLEKHEWVTDATVERALQGSFQFIRFPTVSCQSCATHGGFSSNPAAFSQIQTQIQRSAVHRILALGGQSLLTLAGTVLESSSSNPERNQDSWVVGCASLMFGSSSEKTLVSRAPHSLESLV